MVAVFSYEVYFSEESGILLDKVTKKEKVCFLKEDDIHKMHLAVRPIVRACFVKKNAN